MKTLNNNAKKAQAYINAYNHSDIYSLNQAYGRPTAANSFVIPNAIG